MTTKGRGKLEFEKGPRTSRGTVRERNLIGPRGGGQKGKTQHTRIRKQEGKFFGCAKRGNVKSDSRAGEDVRRPDGGHLSRHIGGGKSEEKQGGQRDNTQPMR